MDEIQRIAEQVASGYLDGAWPGVSVRNLFHEMPSPDAAAHPIIGGHSAWEIALHISYWHDAVRRRLSGEVVEYAPDEDWPRPSPPTDEAWRSALEGVDRAHEALVETIRTLSPERLDDVVPGKTFSVYFMLHGVPQHDLYHGGQVMMLTKAIRARRGARP